MAPLATPNDIRAHLTSHQQFRKYATEGGPAQSGSSNTLLYGAIAAAAAGAGGYYYSTQSGSAEIKKAVHKVEEKVLPPAKPTFTGDWVSLKLEKVEDVNHNTKKLTFLLPDEDHVSGLKVASALLARYKGPGKEKFVIRPYTPISDEDERGKMTLLVKKYEGGPMSTHLHDMAPDQRLELKGPMPKYPYEANKHQHVALIAGGTGITPCFQVARAIFNNPEDKTKVTLVFGNVTEEDILLKHELNHLENTFPQRFRAFYVLNDPPKDAPGFQKGFINKELLKTVLPEPKEDVKIFVCGPPPMYKAISGDKVSPKDQGELEGVLKELGYNKDQVYKF